MQLFDDQLKSQLVTNRKFLSGRSHYLTAFSRISTRLLLQERRRAYYLSRESLSVPPIMIISITNACNLNCLDCYANEQHRNMDQEMDLKTLRYLIADAKALGVGIIMLAGGEPLMKKGILDIVYEHPDMLFVMFTNGLLIRGKILDQMESLKNLIPIISLEGTKDQTDLRRGPGYYDKTIHVMDTLNKKKMLFGTSITVTRDNLNDIIRDEYLHNLENSGVRGLFLIEYVPCSGNLDLCLLPDQKERLIHKVKQIRKDYSMLPVVLPGNEDQYGGCLAAGRGFLHIASTGAVEACPFSPYSDVNVKDMHLIDALRSPLLLHIRDNHHLLEESQGGCALYQNDAFIRDYETKRNSHKCFSLV